MKAQHGNGFTLIEVLVALVLTSSLLAVILSGVATASDRASKADLRREAILLAASRFETEAASPLFPGDRKIEAGRLQLAVSEQQIARDPRGFFALVEIRVTVLDRTQRTIHSLTGRKIKAVEP